MTHDAPQWLVSILEDALEGLGATAPAQERVAEVKRLLEAWTEDVGSQQGTRFLSTMFEKLGQLDGPASDTDLLHMVMAYRITQVPGGWNLGSGTLDEAGSGGATGEGTEAAFKNHTREVTTRLERLGVPRQTVERAADLLEQLNAHRPAETDFDAQILVDADLSVLAVAPQHYRRLTDSLYEHGRRLDPSGFLHGRLNYLNEVLDRSSVFYTPQAAHWEAAARQNLEAERGALQKRLGLESSADHPGSAQGGVRPRSVTFRTSVARKPQRADSQPEPDAPTSPASERAQTDEDQADPPARNAEEDFASTSTLESVADLIDGRIRQKRSGK